MQSFLKSFSTLAILIYLISMLVLVILCNNPVIQALIYLSIAILAALTDKKAVKSVISLSLIIGLPVLIINPLVNGMGATILLRVKDVPLAGNIDITLESLVFTLSLTLKLITTVLIFSLFNILVHRDKLLNLVSFAAARSALVITLTTRMIPSLIDQVKEIGEIQRTRGVDLDSKNLIQRVRNWYPFAKIILFTSLERTYGTAEAIESKAYGIGKRTVFFNEKVKRRDLLLAANSIAVLAISIAGLYKGWLTFTFFPVLSNFINSFILLILAPAVTALVLFPALLAWGYKQWQFLKPRI